LAAVDTTAECVAAILADPSVEEALVPSTVTVWVERTAASALIADSLVISDMEGMVGASAGAALVHTEISDEFNSFGLPFLGRRNLKSLLHFRLFRRGAYVSNLEWD
jgi:hypothetical protein